MMLLMLGLRRLTCSSVLKRGRHDAADVGASPPHLPSVLKRGRHDAADVGASPPHLLAWCRLTCSSVLKRGRHDAADVGASPPHLLICAEAWAS